MRHRLRAMAAWWSTAVLSIIGMMLVPVSGDAAETPAAVVTIPQPASTVRWGAPRFVPGDSNGIVLDFVAQDGISHIGYVRADGSGFTCLSCTAGAAQLSVGRPIPFGDGRRVLAQSPPTSNGVQPLSFVVIECASTVGSCAEPVVYPVRGVGSPDAIQDRLGLISPDGSTLVWTRIRSDGFLMLAGRLDRTDDGYDVHDVRVLNAPADRTTTDMDGLIRANAWYEAKSFTPDGQAITFGATLGGSLNLDSYVMDLRTGAVRRLTEHPDWDEGLEPSPDGRWFTQASSRDQHVTAAFGNLPRPPVVDVAAINVLNYYTPRRVGATEPYRRGAQRRPYVFSMRGEPLAQPILLASAEDNGWFVNDWPDWSADGTRIVWGQGKPDEPAIRQIRVARAPVAPASVVRPGRTRVPSWAPLVEQVPVASLDLRRTLPGPAGGDAVVETSGTLVSGTFSVTYTNYRVGCAVLNGVQTVVQGPAVLETRYTDHLTMTGCHNGNSDIDVIVYGSEGAGSGVGVSTYDAHTETIALDSPPAR
jgi:hypothetical protein